MRITDTMWMRLNYMSAHLGITYSDYNDRTMVALKKRGLVSFSAAQKYGKDCWHLTEEGRKIVETRR